MQSPYTFGPKNASLNSRWPLGEVKSSANGDERGFVHETAPVRVNLIRRHAPTLCMRGAWGSYDEFKSAFEVRMLLLTFVFDNENVRRIELEHWNGCRQPEIKARSPLVDFLSRCLVQYLRLG